MRWMLFGWFLCLAFQPESLESAEQDKPERAAWQRDPKLGLKWQRITGRFLFQRSCLSCHKQGPAQYTRARWMRSLNVFPPKDHPPVTKTFRDLTAMFRAGRMVPGRQSRFDSVRLFLQGTAPEKKSGIEKKVVDLFPQVGEKAPDFVIQDIEGKKLTLKGFHGKRNVLLVFSRANW